MPGAGLSHQHSGKAQPERPAFQPYWGKPAVRNDRGDRGDVGIIRSPVRASILPDCPLHKSPFAPSQQATPYRLRSNGGQPAGPPRDPDNPRFLLSFRFFYRTARSARQRAGAAGPCLANSRRRVAAASQSHPDSSAPGEVERAGRELAAERGLAFAPVQGFQPGPMACRCSRIRLVVKYGRDAR